MNRLLSISLLLLGAAWAHADLLVPASTTYIEPDPDGASVSGASGVSGWTGPANRVEWFGALNATGTLNCAVTLRLPPGASSRLRLAVDGQQSDATAAGNGEVTVNFGPYHIATAGYRCFALESLNAQGAPNGDIESMTLSGAASDGAHFNLKPWRRPASVHLVYPIPAGKNVAAFYCEVTGVDTPVGTYFEACGWDRGYLGMQVNSPTERRIIFSVWDAGKSVMDRSRVADENRTVLVARGDGVDAGGFGGEGTGGHSHLIYPWKNGEKQRFLLTTQPVDATHTVYSGYFFRPDHQQWTLIASWKAPLTGGWLRGLYSFCEGFNPATGEMHRKGLYGNQWIMTADHQWLEVTTAKFSHDPTGKADRLDRYMGLENGQFFLSTGGFLPETMNFGQLFQRIPTGTPPADVVKLAAIQALTPEPANGGNPAAK